MLSSVPPTGISDTDLSIEPLAVSLSLPLNYQSPSTGSNDDISASKNRNSSFRLLRWKSCHDLSLHQRHWTLRRQLTENSFEGRSSAGLVEVYDGNLGISVVPLFINDSNTTERNIRYESTSRNAFGELGKIYLKGPASSPPSLTHYTKKYEGSTTTGKIDKSVDVECSDKSTTCLMSKSTVFRDIKAVTLAP